MSSMVVLCLLLYPPYLLLLFSSSLPPRSHPNEAVPPFASDQKLLFPFSFFSLFHIPQRTPRLASQSTPSSFLFSFPTRLGSVYYFPAFLLPASPGLVGFTLLITLYTRQPASGSSLLLVRPVATRLAQHGGRPDLVKSRPRWELQRLRMS